MTDQKPIPEGKKRAAVFIGRMQPPTRGHYEMLDKLKQYISKNSALKLETFPIVVVIAGSNTDKDLKRNPLSAHDRIAFMQASGLANGIPFLTAKNAYDAFLEVRKKGYEPVAIAAGSDRINEYMKLLDQYFTKDDGSKIKRYKVSLGRDDSASEDTEEVLKSLKSGNETDVDEISGSLARKAVEMNYEKEFVDIVGLKKKPKLAKKMFDKIKAAMASDSSEK